MAQCQPIQQLSWRRQADAGNRPPHAVGKPVRLGHEKQPKRRPVDQPHPATGQRHPGDEGELHPEHRQLRRLREGMLSHVEDDDLVRMCFGSEDFRNGVKSFVARKPPVWTGR